MQHCTLSGRFSWEVASEAVRVNESQPNPCLLTPSPQTRRERTPGSLGTQKERKTEREREKKNEKKQKKKKSCMLWATSSDQVPSSSDAESSCSLDAKRASLYNARLLAQFKCW